MLAPLVGPEIVDFAELGPVLVEVSELPLAEQTLIKLEGSIAVWVNSIMISEAAEIGQISAGRPKSMNCERFSIPSSVPSRLADLLSAELPGPCKRKRIEIIVNFLTG